MVRYSSVLLGILTTVFCFLTTYVLVKKLLMDRLIGAMNG